MDIHKPKPIHTRRDFLKEVGTIVLGVSIALAAEQAVEYFHWRNEVAVARKELRAEIAGLDVAYVRHIALSPCISRQIGEAGAILDSLQSGKTPPSFTVFHHGSPLQIRDSDWQSERSSQILTHFPRAELALMGRFYSDLPGLSALVTEGNTAWSQLSILQNPPPGLGTAEIARLRGELDRVRQMEYVVLLNAHRMLKLSEQMGIARPQPDAVFTKLFCTMSDDKFQPAMIQAAAQP